MKRLFFILILFGFTISNFDVYAINVVLHSGNTSICEGSCTNINAQVTGAIGSVVFAWSPLTYLSGSNDSMKTACPLNTITYKLIVKDVLNNKDSATITITVKPKPDANFTFSPNYACAATPVTFTNTSTGGNSYLWNFGDGTTSTTSSPSHSFPAVIGNNNSQYNVKLVVTNNATGCKDSITKTITIKKLPDPALTELSNFNNCAYSSSSNQYFLVNVINSSTTNNTSYTIIWGDGSSDYIASSFSTVTHTYTQQGEYQLVFQVTGANGCSNSKTYQVTNISNPAISFGNPGNTQGCGPKLLCFPISDYSQNYSSTIYVVNFGDGSPKIVLAHPPPDTICHTYSKSSCGLNGTGCVNCFVATITAKNACDSTLTTTNNIKVYTTPKANFNAPQSGCVNQSITFQNSTSPGFDNYCNSTALYTWNFGDGSPPVIIGNTSSQTHSYSVPGNYQITLSVQNYCGSDTIKKNICINPLPNAKFTYDDSVFCAPSTVNFTNLSVVTNVCGSTNYTWSITCYNDSCNAPACGGYSFINGTNSHSENPVINFTQPGKYNIKLTASNGCNPAATYNKTIRVKSKPNVNMSTLPSFICEGSSITPTITFKNCYGDNISFLWNLPGGNITTSTSQNPGTITYNTAGTYPVDVTVSNECGDVTINNSIKVNATPIINQINDIFVCPSTLINIGNFISNIPGTSYTWTNNNTGIGIGSSGSGNIPSWIAPGNETGGNITGTIIVKPYLNGCYGPQISFEVTIYPIPILTVNSPVICEGDKTTLIANGTDTYLWSTGSTNNSIIVSPNVTTIYTISGTDTITGCTNSANSTVIVHPLPVVEAGPNIFACNQPIPITLTAYSPPNGTWTGNDVTSSGVFTPSTTGNFTLTYTYTNPSTNCTNFDTMTVQVVDLQLVDAGNGFSICADAPQVTLSGYMPTGGTWSGNGISGNVFNPTVAGSGTFTLTYSFGTGTCLSSDTIMVTVYPLPQINVNSATICEGQSITLNANGAHTYLWSTIETTSSIIVNPITSTTYSVTTTDTLTGCTNSTISNVIVNPLAVATASPLQLSICSNNNAQISLSSNIGGTTFNWTVNAPSGISGAVDGSGNQINQNLTTTLNNIDSVIYTITPTASNCPGTSIIATVVVNPIPVVNVTPLQQTICSGDTALPITFFSNVSGTTFSWTASAPSSITGYQSSGTGNIPSMKLNNTSNNTGTVIYTVTPSANGCTGNSVQASVIVNPSPTVNNTPLIQHICSGSASNQVVLTSGVPNTNFNWSVINSGVITGFTPSGSNIIPSQILYNNSNNADTVVYHIIPSVNSGVLCPGKSSDYLIVVHPVPYASFAMNNTIGCSPLNIAFTNQSTPLGLIYNWDFGNGHYSNLSAPNFTFTNTGIIDSIYQITLTVNDSSSVCPADIDQQTITVHPGAVIAAFTIDKLSGCSPLTVNFTNNSAASTNYFWDFGDANVSNTLNPTHTYTTPGQYIASLIVNNGCGYDTAYSNTITAHPVVTPVISFNDYVCVYETVNFTNTAAGITDYLWDFGDGSPLSNLPAPNHNYSNHGDYQVTLIANNQYNCVDTANAIVHIKYVPEAAFASSSDAGCSPLKINFHNLTDSLTFNTYSWNFNNGNTSSLTTPTLQTFTNNNHCQDTNYTIMMIANNNNCVDTFFSYITVYPVPVSDFSSDDGTYCTFDMPSLIHFNQQSLCAQNFQWLLGNFPVSTEANPDIYFPYPATHELSLVATNQHQCSDTITKDFIVYPYWEYYVSLNPVSGCEPHGVNFEASMDSLTYLWNFGDNLTSNQSSGYHLYLNDNIYTVNVYAYGIGGCIDSLQMEDTIKVWPQAKANFTSVNANFAPPNDGTYLFTNYSENATIFLWDFGDGNTFHGWDTIHKYDANKCYDVILYANNIYNCPDTTQEEICLDSFYGLFIPNAFSPGASDPLLHNFQPVGIGLKSYNIEIYDTWGNLIWESTTIDSEGKPTEFWDGTHKNGSILPMDAYVWKASAVFMDGTIWQGMDYGNGFPKRYGTVTIIK